MTKRIPESLIQEIRRKADIVEIVSNYMPLTKKGKNFLGLCPFHNDSNPSMAVSPEKQIYKCFVCGSGGNVFQFVENFEKVSFVESVIKVGALVHMDLSDYQHTEFTVKVDEKTQTMLSMIREVQVLTQFQLKTPSGKQGYDFMKRRGYSDALLEYFGVGFLGNENQVTHFLSAKGYEPHMMIQADLVRDTDQGLKDVFYQRVLFPIDDAKGNIVGFSGRTIEPQSSVKYINTKETSIYVKGHILYNLSRAYQDIKKDREIIITEGVTDTFAFHEAGMRNVVSLLGVACTSEHIRLIQSVATHVTLAFDGDRAGFEASYKVGLELVNSNLNVSVWYSKEGLDPDETVRQHGIESLVEGYQQRVSWFDFLLMYAMSLYGVHSFEAKADVVKFMTQHLKEADTLTRDHYSGVIAEKTGLDKTVIFNQMGAQSHKIAPPVTQYEVQDPLKQMLVLERDILKALLESKTWSYLYRDVLGFMITPLANDCALILLNQYYHVDELEIADVLSQDMDETLQKALIELSEMSPTILTDIQLEESFEGIRRYAYEKGTQAVQNQIYQSLDEEEQLRLLEETIFKKQRRSQ